MRVIPLTRGLECWVDDEDYDHLTQFKWKADSDGYAVRNIPHPLGSRHHTLLPMHRQILGLTFGDGLLGDHINENKRDNRRHNLRVATKAENNRNRGAMRNNTSGFKGVSWSKSSKRWLARIGVNGRLKSLGYFDTPEDAHEFYCLAVDMLHGEFGNHGVMKC